MTFSPTDWTLGDWYIEIKENQYTFEIFMPDLLTLTAWNPLFDASLSEEFPTSSFFPKFSKNISASWIVIIFYYILFWFEKETPTDSLYIPAGEPRSGTWSSFIFAML